MDTLEKKRLLTLVKYEKLARVKGFFSIAGVDEVGRGPLAGPVLACACIIEKGVFFTGINDSKKLSEEKRKALFFELTNHKKVKFAIGEVSHLEIDQLNIYQATIKAMKQAIDSLPKPADYLLIDGMHFNHYTLSGQILPGEKIIEGDAKSQSIAAASIIAKEIRDNKMRGFDEIWPEYGFSQHKGYGTKQHLEAIKKHGPCPIHRLSFRPFKVIDQAKF